MRRLAGNSQHAVQDDNAPHLCASLADPMIPSCPRAKPGAASRARACGPTTQP